MLPKHLHKYFWNTDVRKINIKEDSRYIVLKLLEYGDVQDLKWMFKVFPKRLIRETLMTKRGLSLKSVNFWRLFFNIPENKILCLSKSYQNKRKQIWLY